MPYEPMTPEDAQLAKAMGASAGAARRRRRAYCSISGVFDET